MNLANTTRWASTPLYCYIANNKIWHGNILASPGLLLIHFLYFFLLWTLSIHHSNRILCSLVVKNTKKNITIIVKPWNKMVISCKIPFSAIPPSIYAVLVNSSFCVLRVNVLDFPFSFLSKICYRDYILAFSAWHARICARWKKNRNAKYLMWLTTIYQIQRDYLNKTFLSIISDAISLADCSRCVTVKAQSFPPLFFIFMFTTANF